MWWHRLLILAPKRWRPTAVCEFEASLLYRVPEQRGIYRNIVSKNKTHHHHTQTQLQKPNKNQEGKRYSFYAEFALT